MDPAERKRVEMERRGRLMRGESLSELRALTEAELHEKYYALMELTSETNINRDALPRCHVAGPKPLTTSNPAVRNSATTWEASLIGSVLTSGTRPLTKERAHQPTMSKPTTMP